MSDILIKNMEMPKDGDTYGLHLVIYPSGEVWIAYDDKPITEAIEIPSHGRLIDADELVGNISDTYCEECPKTKPIMCKACEYEDIMDDIENAPTILEASNE